MSSIDEQTTDALSEIPANNVISAITFNLKKNDKVFDKKIGELWDLSNEAPIKFANAVQKKFSGTTVKMFGYFTDERPPARVALENYLENNDLKALCNILAGKMVESAHGNTRGGFIVLMHFNENNKDFLLVVMVDNEDAFDFDEKMSPTSFNSINLKTLKQAARYDLTILHDILNPADDSASDEVDEYLCFIRGSSDSNYFKKALGDLKSVSAEKCMKNIQTAIDSVKESFKLGPIESDILDEKYQSFLEKNYGSNVKVETLATVVDAFVAENITMEEDLEPFSFLSFINTLNIAINPVFKPDADILLKIRKIKVKNDSMGFRYEIDPDLLGEEDSIADIKVSRDRQSIIFPIPFEQQGDVIKALERKKTND